MHSRVHRLSTFDTPLAKVYVKRDDELSFGVSGSKLRKYSSLLPYILQQGAEQAILVGSPYSNHVLSLSQLLIENRIQPILFLGGRKPTQIHGNFFFTSLLVPDKQIYWTPKGEESASALAYQQAQIKLGKRAIYIPMGALIEQSIPGARTLCSDIERNETLLSISFDHIFIDAGTGTTAASLILQMCALERTTKVHVIQMAGSPHEFTSLLERFAPHFAPIHSPLNYTLSFPHTAKAFGSINSSVKKMILHMARSEGVFVDPLYNAKLFLEGKRQLEMLSLEGNILFVHSGGGLSLAGFTQELGFIL